MTNIFKMSKIDTPLGDMVAISDDESLYLLEFADQLNLWRNIDKLKATITNAVSTPIISIIKELNAYFDGTLKQFKTPLHLVGSVFQKLAWQELLKTRYGTTKSYSDQAMAIGKSAAYRRAVASANGANKIAIVIPCHRIINSNGNMGGYAAGVERKKWLINHEKQYTN